MSIQSHKLFERINIARSRNSATPRTYILLARYPTTYSATRQHFQVCIFTSTFFDKLEAHTSQLASSSLPGPKVPFQVKQHSQDHSSGKHIPRARREALCPLRFDKETCQYAEDEPISKGKMFVLSVVTKCLQVQVRITVAECLWLVVGDQSLKGIDWSKPGGKYELSVQ